MDRIETDANCAYDHHFLVEAFVVHWPDWPDKRSWLRLVFELLRFDYSRSVGDRSPIDYRYLFDSTISKAGSSELPAEEPHHCHLQNLPMLETHLMELI